MSIVTTYATPAVCLPATLRRNYCPSSQADSVVAIDAPQALAKRKSITLHPSKFPSREERLM